MAADELSPSRAHALLDILSHYEVYTEIEDFRYPGTLNDYGPPFKHEAKKPSTSPSLQSLLIKFIVNLPGLKNVPERFWREQCFSIIDDLEKAELSESYDKGQIGTRRTVATAISALIEYPVRGVFTGFDEPASNDLDGTYDKTRAEELQRACRDSLYQIVYGDLLDELFTRAAETDKLSDHKALVQAAHEFGLVNLASFMHYTLILSPKGQQILTILEHANKLVPYGVIKQTLKIGNVASMMNAMLKVVLAKVSMGSVTNWIGWTQGADEGMNLMQHILSVALNWDTRGFKSQMSKIEKNKNGPKKEQLTALKSYLSKSRDDHERLRQKSKSEAKSMVEVILEEEKVTTQLNPAQHKQALEYLAAELSVRDREQITQVLCHSQPDHLSAAIRDAADAYEPVIRSVHNAVDLSDTVTDFEVFLKDMINLAKIRNQEGARGRPSFKILREKDTPPVATVGDFVQLLKKHQSSSHKFLHQCAKNGPEMTKWFYEYARYGADQFKRKPGQTTTFEDGSKPAKSAGSLAEPLKSLFAELSEGTRKKLLPILDAHSKYVAKMHAASAVRLQTVIDSPQSKHPALSSSGSGSFTPRNLSRHSSRPSSGRASPTSETQPGTDSPPSEIENSAALDKAPRVDSTPGPGSFLSRWEDLLDHTKITPELATGGHVRKGTRGGGGTAPVPLEKQQGASHNSPLSHEVSASQTDEQDNDDEEDVFEDAHERLGELGLKDEDKVPAPDVQPVWEALGRQYRQLLADQSCTW